MSVIVNGTEIILTGTVGGDPWWDDDVFSQSDVISALAKVGRDADVTVRVNSGGGVATEGAAIHSAFATHKGKVHMVVEGWAASAASLFVMAGDRITMRPGSLLMIHDPAASVWGTADDHRRGADALDVMSGVYAQVYADRCKKTPEAVRGMMRAETWLGPDEAVKEGFADAADGDAAEAPEPVAFAHVRAYARAPERIVALAKSRGWTARASMAASPAAPTRSKMEHSVTDTPQAGTEPATTENPGTTPTTDPATVDTAPADPVAIAEACAKGGYPELTAALLKAGATMSAVTERIGEAKAIADACSRLRVPDMAGKLIASGVSLETARDLASAAAAGRSDSIVTDTTRASAPAHSPGPKLDHKAIYARMNGIKTKE